MRKKLLLFVVTLLAVASFGLVQLNAKAVVDDTPDCDKYAIIYCGAKDEAQFKARFNADGHYKDHTKVYAAFGITKADVTGMVNGTVWRNGNVTVGNTIVATGARDAARNLGGTPIAGTTAAITSVSTFGTEGQTAMVKMVNGVFKFAVIKSCGNPVTAHPKLPPTPPKPPVVPTAVCDRLTITPIVNTRNQVKLAASAKTTNGGKVIAYNYYFGDGTKSTTPAPSATHTYPDTPTAKTYTITLTVTVQLGSVKKDVTAATCKGTFTTKAQPPVYSCDLLTVKEITRGTFNFTTKYTAQNATYKSTTYVIRDEAGKEIARQAGTTYTNTTTGKYTVEALVTFTVNGKDVTTAVNNNCKKPFEVEKIPETPTAVCDGLDVDQISETNLSRTFIGGATVAGGATITGYTIDFGDTTEPQVINSTSDKITAMHTYKEAKEYTAKLSVKVKLNGKDEVKTSKDCEVTFTISPKVCTAPNGQTYPEGDKRCSPCPVPGKEQFPADDKVNCKEDCTTPGHENNAECLTTPPTPPELPTTGMSDNIVALVGAGSLIAAVGYYVASRRALIG